MANYDKKTFDTKRHVLFKSFRLSRVYCTACWIIFPVWI